MPMRDEIVTELKRSLRASGHTYADVARQLRLSVPSVKRLFTSGDLSLQRVDGICELMGIELAVIIDRALDRRTPQNQLTRAQEKEIAADPKLFLLTWLVLGRTSHEEILKAYRFTAAEVQKYLIRLDRLKVVELQPGNRVRILVNRRFSWIPGGPVQRFIHERLLREFLASDFSGDGDEFFFHGDAVSETALLQLKRALQNAARECMGTLERDHAGKQKRKGAAFVLALRQWEYSGFEEWRRRPVAGSGG